MRVLSSELKVEARAHAYIPPSPCGQSFGAWNDHSLEGRGSRNGCSALGLGLDEWG